MPIRIIQDPETKLYCFRNDSHNTMFFFHTKNLKSITCAHNRCLLFSNRTN